MFNFRDLCLLIRRLVRFVGFVPVRGAKGRISMVSGFLVLRGGRNLIPGAITAIGGVHPLPKRNDARGDVYFHYVMVASVLLFPTRLGVDLRCVLRRAFIQCVLRR